MDSPTCARGSVCPSHLRLRRLRYRSKPRRARDKAPGSEAPDPAVRVLVRDQEDHRSEAKDLTPALESHLASVVRAPRARLATARASAAPARMGQSKKVRGFVGRDRTALLQMVRDSKAHAPTVPRQFGLGSRVRDRTALDLSDRVTGRHLQRRASW